MTLNWTWTRWRVSNVLPVTMQLGLRQFIGLRGVGLMWQ